jgi:glycosyltransferase involved in cell wall biosynthesis
MTRRRVLIVPAWYPTAEDPVTGIFVREQAALVAARHEVVVLYPFEPGAPARGLWSIAEAEEDGIRTVRVRRRRLPVPKHELPLAVAATRAALRRLRAEGFVPDVLHAHVFTAGAVARAAVGRRVPVIVTEHLSDIGRARVEGIALRVARFAYRRADLLAPVSENLAERLRRLADTPTRVIPNVVDTARFRPPVDGQRPAAPPERLLAVAGLVPVKDVPTAIEAFARVRRERPDARLEILGDGPERARCEGVARRLGVWEGVRFAGRVERDAVAERMRTSHLLVSASAYESLPGNQLEALASGLPVVATAVGGVPHVIDDEVGRLVLPGDPEALAAAILDVLAHRDAYDPARIAARTRERYGPEHVAALWDEVYEELASRG